MSEDKVSSILGVPDRTYPVFSVPDVIALYNNSFISKDEAKRLLGLDKRPDGCQCGENCPCMNN